MGLLHSSWHFPQNHRAHIALLGGALYFSRARPRFAAPAMGISFLATCIWMIFGCVLASLPWGLAFWRRFCFGMVFGINSVLVWGPWGGRFGGIVWGGFWRCRSMLYPPSWAHIASSWAPRWPKLIPRRCQHSHKKSNMASRWQVSTRRWSQHSFQKHHLNFGPAAGEHLAKANSIYIWLRHGPTLPQHGHKMAQLGPT